MQTSMRRDQDRRTGHVLSEGQKHCVVQFSRELFRRRSWGPMAESETFAHLEHLRLLGEAERHLDDEKTFRYVTSSA